MIRVRICLLERIFLLIASLLFIVGCVPEKKIGSEYLSKLNSITMVIKAPRGVKIVNQSYDSIENWSALSDRERDSVKYYQTKVLQDIVDSTLIINYVRNLQTTFVNLGYKAIIASGDDSVYAVKGDAILVNVGQIELDEKVMPIRDETRYNNKLYGADYDMVKIEFCVWLELSKIENGRAVLPPRVLYDSVEKTDDDDGHFQWDYQKNQMNYVLTQNEVLPLDIYSLASLIGSNHGLRLNDFFLNEYIANFLPQKKDRFLFGVNQKFGTLYRIYEMPFLELHE